MVNRGEVWWVDLPDPVASEAGYKRPVLVIQSDSFNRSRIQTVLVIAISSNLRLAEAPGNVKLAARKSGLPKESVANVSQLITLDKEFLKEKAGKVDRTTLYQIEQGIRLILSLP